MPLASRDVQTSTYDPVKRVIDVLGATAGAVFLSPVLALIAWLVKRRLGTPVIFRQERAGRHGEVFTLYKFRTMLEGDGPDEERLTPFGAALRSTSLDELPELYNVLRGDMSLVGPRPLLARYWGRYSAEQRRRHEVRPGLTGLAQVSGRNATDWDTRLALDVEYVERRSLGLDLQILLRTLVTVVSRRGSTPLDSVTMPEFFGAG